MLIIAPTAPMVAPMAPMAFVPTSVNSAPAMKVHEINDRISVLEKSLQNLDAQDSAGKNNNFDYYVASKTMSMADLNYNPHAYTTML